MATYAKLRSEVTPDVRALFDFLWGHFQKNNQWPTHHDVHRDFLEQRKLEKILKTSTGALVQKDHQNLQLRTLGVLCTSDADTYVQWLRKLTTFLRDIYYAPKRRDLLTDAEISDTLKIPSDQVRVLGKVLQNGGVFSIYSQFPSDKPGWQMNVPFTSIAPLPREGSIDEDFDEELNRLAAQEWKIDHEERARDFARLQPTFPGFEPEQYFDRRALRRYQVFVSSTYEDLKEERRHVIQALLDSRCIPAGMELFPAASTEQWSLIQQVIEESDYYVVIVAGRYGASPPRSQLSYTEREFDYARKIGKPILGFYHPKPGSIQRDFCEREPERQRRLEEFTAKVKKKLCKPWTNPVELGSAVKTAVQHAIIHDPRPGWVRVRE